MTLNILMPLLTTIACAIFLTWYVRRRLIRALPPAWKRVLESMRDGVIILDDQGHIADLNPAAQKIIGRDVKQLIGQEATQVLPEWGDVLEIPSNEERTVTKEVMTQEAEIREYDISLSPLYSHRQTVSGQVILTRDISEKRQIEEERRRISKLESIGILASGVAHDFNNNFATILGYLSMAKQDMSLDDIRFKYITVAEEAALHARTLSQQLLSSARGGAPVKVELPIADVLKKTVSFTLNRSNIRCDWMMPEDLWPVVADQGQMIQVIQNLFINASQAMPHGGIIAIKGENEVFNQATVVGHTTLEPGFYVKLSIKDQGYGIAPEQLDKIFEPYFTTKETGTGLGLTTAHSIIKRHEGALTVSSAPHRGTTFTIYLPASVKPVRGIIEESPK